MAASDEHFRNWIESLAAEGIDAGDLEAELIGRIGRLRIKRDQHAKEVEAARLLPHGAVSLAERQHCHRSTIYRRAERGRHVVATFLTRRDKSAV